MTASQVEDFKKKFFDLQHDKQRSSIALLSDKDVVDVPYGDGHVLAFYIPRATHDQRPVYVGLDPMETTYRRDHEGDYICDRTAVSQMFAERELTHAKTESRILANYSWDDIDKESFRQYRTIFTNMTPGHAWVTLDDQALMSRLGGYRKDRRTGEEGFTVAGILMFGKTESITDLECLPDFSVDYREIPADTTRMRWVDRLYPDGSWEANLFQFYRKVLLKLYAFLPKPFILVGDERQDESPTHEAVREALINCIVHASYAKFPKIVIEKRPDNIVMSNPGTLLISQTQYFEGGHSVCRNPSLQKMFGLIGRSDKAGSGVDKILKGWKFAKWRKPHLYEKSRPDMVDIYLPLESLLSEETLHGIKQIYGKSAMDFPHEELIVLAAAYSDSKVSNMSLQGLLDMHPSDITKLLRGMCKDGLLLSSGFGRGTVYHLNHDYNTSSDVPSPDSTSSDSTSSDVSSSDSTSSDVSSPDSASGYVSNPNSTSPDVSSSDVSSSDVSSSDVSSSDSTSSDVSSSDVSSSDSTSSDISRPIKERIISYTKHSWRTTKEIAFHIGRNPIYTRRIIRSMVADGALIPEHEIPTHPAQRYKSARRQTSKTKQ